MISNKINEYIGLCSKLYHDIPDVSPANVKRHNAAMGQIEKFELEMAAHPDLAGAVYRKLLENEDCIVQLHAAAGCLKLGIYTNEAVAILEQICSASNSLAAFEAEGVLMTWRKRAMHLK